MSRNPAVVLIFALSAAAVQTALGAGQTPPATRWVSQDAVLVIEVSKPKELIDMALDSELAATLTSLPAYDEKMSDPEFKKFFGVVRYLETTLDTDWRSGLGDLLAGGVTLAVYPDDTVLLIAEAKDAQLLGRLHDIMLTFAKQDAANKGAPGVESGDYRGVTGYSFGKKEAHAIIGNRLLVANKPEALKAAVDLHADPDGPSLALLPDYQSAVRAVGPSPIVSAFVNTKALKEQPKLKRVLERNTNPLMALLFAGATGAIKNSTWAAAGLSVDKEGLSLSTSVGGGRADPDQLTNFATPDGPGEGALPNVSVPRLIAAMSFYRDLHGFYAAKDELFPERTSGLIFFENMMGIFFTGRDLTDEVLAQTGPEVRFVVAEQEYDSAAGTPEVQIPAFAALFRLHDPEQFGPVVEEAWQKAIGMVNFTRGQNAEPGLLIDRPVHDDVKFTAASFSAPPAHNRAAADIRFNFRPSLAVVGNNLILSSTDALACDLIDAVKKEAAEAVKPLTEIHSLAEINTAGLSSILSANREKMIVQNMLKEGNSRQQAENVIDMILTLTKHLGSAELNVGIHDDQTTAVLELHTQ